MNKMILLTAAFILASVPLAAQFGGPGRGGPEGPPGFHNRKVVTGLPYKATVTTTVNQTLANGTVIQRTSTGTIARDADGRTYEQQTFNGGPLGQNGSRTLIFITDPLAGYRYVLDPVKKTAVRRPFKAPPASPDNAEAGPDHFHPKNANVSEKSLPSDSSSGVAADGKEISFTIPAGAIGNSAPIVSTVDRWYSPDLKIVVKSVRTDPRFGTSTYSLSGITTDVPASLFTVPSDYTVTDAPAHGNHRPF